jgi:hypothetical protein
MVVAVVALVATGVAPAATAGGGAISLRWTDRAGVELEGVAVGPDGSVVVVGHKVEKDKTKAIVSSYAPDGTRQWTAGWSPGGRASTRGMAVDVGEDGTIAWIGRVYGIHCEGGGWFVEVRRATGALVGRYVTPGWECGLAEHVADVEVGADQIVIAGYDHGCCDDPFTDGWIRAFTLDAFPTWTTDFEPPEGTPIEYFERASGVAITDTGEIYASGWAASEEITEGYVWPGSLVVQKMTSGGGVLWRQVAYEGRYSWTTTAAIAVREQMVMVLGATRPFSVTWGGKAPATTWLARMTTDGTVNWTRTWGEDWPTATQSDDLSIDGQMNTWVVGTRRDPDDRGYDLSLRRIGPAGGLNWHLKDLDTTRYLYGTGVAAIGKSGAAVVGFETEGRNDPGVAGHVWTFGPGSA